LLSSYGSRGGGGGGGSSGIDVLPLFDERPDPACEVDAQADERDREQAIQELETALVDSELRHREPGHVPLKIVDPIIQAAVDITDCRPGTGPQDDDADDQQSHASANAQPRAARYSMLRVERLPGQETGGDRCARDQYPDPRPELVDGGYLRAQLALCQRPDDLDTWVRVIRQDEVAVAVTQVRLEVGAAMTDAAARVRGSAVTGPLRNRPGSCSDRAVRTSQFEPRDGQLVTTWSPSAAEAAETLSGQITA